MTERASQETLTRGPLVDKLRELAATPRSDLNIYTLRMVLLHAAALIEREVPGD